VAPRISFAADAYSDNILVFVFQRGGIDGLSFLAPMDGHADRGNYEALRSNGTMIPSIDLQLLGGGWGLHPAAAPLVDLWTNNSLAIVEAIDWANYLPANGAAYPTQLTSPESLTSFASEMKIIAQLIKEDTGVRVAQTDIGGWDTHTQQGNNTTDGGYYDNVRDLSASLLAFFTDLDVPSPNGKTWAERTTLMVYSEFGRRAYDNADAGTDHGWGNNLLAMGGGVNGGQLYGPWPGLAEQELYQEADVWATTDYRTVFSECLLKRFNNDSIWDIFPGYTEAEYQPLGVFSGSFVQPVFVDPQVIFEDGMEG